MYLSEIVGVRQDRVREIESGNEKKQEKLRMNLNDIFVQSKTKNLFSYIFLK